MPCCVILMVAFHPFGSQKTKFALLESGIWTMFVAKTGNYCIAIH